MSVQSRVGAQHELLSSIPLLAGADEQTLTELAQCLRPVEVRAGEIVIRQGDPADRMFLVRSGRLRVLVDQEDGLRTVRELGVGRGDRRARASDRRAAVGHRAGGSGRRAARARRRRLPCVSCDRDPGLAVAVARALAVQLQASGGLSMASPRPAVISVRALGPAVAAVELAQELGDALGLFGAVETLTGDESGEGHAGVARSCGARPRARPAGGLAARTPVGAPSARGRPTGTSCSQRREPKTRRALQREPTSSSSSRFPPRDSSR